MLHALTKVFVILFTVITVIIHIILTVLYNIINGFRLTMVELILTLMSYAMPIGKRISLLPLFNLLNKVTLHSLVSQLMTKSQLLQMNMVNLLKSNRQKSQWSMKTVNVILLSLIRIMKN
jgi:hypothetical protein